MLLQKILYNIGIQSYKLLVDVVSISNRKAKLFKFGRKNWKERYQLAFQNETRETLWIHCASLGEFEQGRPLIEIIKKEFPEIAIVLTFFSPSGYEVRKNYKNADYIWYLPLDTSHNAQTFIDIINPKLVIFVKYEFWYHYLHLLAANNIPTIQISSIFQDRHPFFKWYGGFNRVMLTYFSQIFVQNKSSALLLESIDFHKYTIAGDTRIDSALTVSNSKVTYPKLINFIKDQEVLIAGSTWEDDELLLKELVSLQPKLKLVIAPHEIDEAHIEKIRLIFPTAQLWDGAQAIDNESSVLIINTIGHLSKLYRYADYVWIGGGFTKTGIHNAIEAAVYGKPLCWGPRYQRYQEALDLIALGAAHTCDNAELLNIQIQKWQQDNVLKNKTGLIAKDYCLAQAGATQTILNYCFEENAFFTIATNS